MNTQKWLYVLIVISLVTVIGSAAGCGTAAPAAPTAKPTIDSFAISPTSINQGERTTLSWATSGATAITIQPNIGAVGPAGSLILTPSAAVTYTLTASNDAGSATGTASVNVTSVIAGKPDLVVTGIFLSASEVYYTIKNQGNAVAPPSTTYFYVNNLKKSSDWVDFMAPGQEKTQYFSNFEWTFTSAEPSEAKFVTYNVKACADAENTVEESNKDNNCLIEVWGPEFVYDFVQQAHLAKWTTSAGDLIGPMSNLDVRGGAYVITYSPTLVMCPEYVNKGWIIGKFGDFYVDKDTHAAMVRDIVLPELAQFTSKVGFDPGTKSPDGVTVALGYFDAMGGLVFFNKMTVNSDGQMHDYNVDLSNMAGQHTQFVLFVQANGSREGNCLRWLSPRIGQKATPSM